MTLLDPRVGRVLEDPRVERVERVTATKRSRRPIKMPSSYHAQIRWLVVYKRFFLGLSPRDIAESVHVSHDFQKKIVRLFLETGNVVISKDLASSRRLRWHSDPRRRHERCTRARLNLSSITRHCSPSFRPELAPYTHVIIAPRAQVVVKVTLSGLAAVIPREPAKESWGGWVLSDQLAFGASNLCIGFRIHGSCGEQCGSLVDFVRCRSL